MAAESALKQGILLVQLGTPASPEVADVRRYLKQFLSDPYMVRVNRFAWKVILNGFVLPSCASKSAAHYRRIWTAQGSPLKVFSAGQTQGAAARLCGGRTQCMVAYGMRYGEPSIESALSELAAAGCRKALIFPLFPQYSTAINPSIEEEVQAALKRSAIGISCKIAGPFFAAEPYIGALAGGINRFLAGLQAQPQALLLSYHGLPEAFVRGKDPYCSMCAQTTALLVPKLKFPAERVLHTYQSRFGGGKWVAPYTDDTIKMLANQGVKRLAAACPGFVSDCVETLYEIGIESRDMFLRNSGESFNVAPCLNCDTEWIEALSAMIQAELE